MSTGQGFFHTKQFKLIMSKVYSWGASVVIIGAMAKIEHWSWADYALIGGLSTEAFIFFISAFEPIHEELDWTLVYPELAGMDPKKKEEKKSMTKELDKMLEEARIEQGMINRLGESLRGLTDNVSKMSVASDAALATNEYAKKVTLASASVERINESYMNAIDAFDKFNRTMGELAGSEDSAKQMKSEFTKLNSNLNSLNNIYGNMLSAMGGPRG